MRSHSIQIHAASLTPDKVHTGEEEEDTVYQVRGKLFTLSAQNVWKERGTGMLRLNVRREDGGGARLSEYTTPDRRLSD